VLHVGVADKYGWMVAYVEQPPESLIVCDVGVGGQQLRGWAAMSRRLHARHHAATLWGVLLVLWAGQGCPQAAVSHQVRGPAPEGCTGCLVQCANTCWCTLLDGAH
jgi:hypothetical protein